MSSIKRLKELYMESGKHSNYQSLPISVRKILPQEQLATVSRYDEARLKYICAQVEFQGKNILDIGGNTGFFTFESLRFGANHVDYYEGNKTHAEFVETASKVLQCENQINVFPEYWLFDQNQVQYDIIFCLNVVHHLGDDFKSGTDMQSAKEEMLDCINNLANITDIMIFQMGYNWCGNRECCLFEKGTKIEMEQFLKNGTAKYWDILKCGIAEKKNDEILYYDMNEKNNVRIDDLGEFLNRPIFIMQSKRSKI